VSDAGSNPPVPEASAVPEAAATVVPEAAAPDDIDGGMSPSPTELLDGDSTAPVVACYSQGVCLGFLPSYTDTGPGEAFHGGLLVCTLTQEDGAVVILPTPTTGTLATIDGTDYADASPWDIGYCDGICCLY